MMKNRKRNIELENDLKQVKMGVMTRKWAEGCKNGWRRVLVRSSALKWLQNEEKMFKNGQERSEIRKMVEKGKDGR